MVQSDWISDFDYKSLQTFKKSFSGKTVLERRYLCRDEHGKVCEEPEDMFWRVACNIASAEGNFGAGPEGVKRAAVDFYKLMCSGDFLPNSPTLMNAGRVLQQLSACFVLPIEDSMDSIFEAIKQTAIIHKTGGGTGFSFSAIRPARDPVSSTGGAASGPVSFMKVFNSATDVVKQGGTRRGANMGILRVDHPDVLEFITSKDDQVSMTNFNISVAVTDKFMEALERGGEYDLINPRTGEKSGSLSAQEVFDLIVEMAWKNGEPGVVFIDRINRFNPTPNAGSFDSTNPCGEQPLLPYESCNLGSVNLSNMLKGGESPEIDWEKFGSVVHLAVRFLDDVIEMNRFPLEQIRRKTLANRKIGLGVMGFADMLIKMGVPYDSERAVSLAESVMRFIREKGFEASAELARERGAFPNFEGSVYDVPGGVRYRNATVTTIAPTGSISIIAGCSSGIEPLFALSFLRRILDNDEFIETHELFRKAVESRGLLSDSLLRRVAEMGSIASFRDLPEDLRRVFVVSHDISPEWHVRMQAAFQKYTDNAVSKTVNFPSEATREDVKAAFSEAYRLGCKGVTVYRDGSRDSQVLNIRHEKGDGDGAAEITSRKNASFERNAPRDRPDVTEGITERVMIGCGNMYVTVNFDDVGLCEVFTHTGKGGGCPSQSEAVGRLVSLALRSDVSLDAVIKQLRGIKCVSCTRKPGLGVQSCPDAISKVIERAIRLMERRSEANEELRDELNAISSGLGGGAAEAGSSSIIPQKCPECGSGIDVEGRCYTCRNCGFSKCG